MGAWMWMGVEKTLVRWCSCRCLMVGDCSMILELCWLWETSFNLKFSLFYASFLDVLFGLMILLSGCGILLRRILMTTCQQSSRRLTTEVSLIICLATLPITFALWWSASWIRMMCCLLTNCFMWSPNCPPPSTIIWKLLFNAATSTATAVMISSPVSAGRIDRSAFFLDLVETLLTIL